MTNNSDYSNADIRASNQLVPDTNAPNIVYEHSKNEDYCADPETILFGTVQGTLSNGNIVVITDACNIYHQ